MEFNAFASNSGASSGARRVETIEIIVEFNGTIEISVELKETIAHTGVCTSTNKLMCTNT